MIPEVPRVAVLMSSYNGENYIEEQIDSILRQKGVQVDLYVRDDCSTDSTRQILRRYAKEGKLTFIEGKENLRPGRSFMEILYTVASVGGYEYYAFADQDDIWLEEKLLRAVSKIESIGVQTGNSVACGNRNMVKNGIDIGYGGGVIPALYCSNLTIFKDGHKQGLRFDKPPNLDIASLISKNQCCGCTFLINGKLADLIIKQPIPPERILKYCNHDAWILYVGTIAGVIYYDHESHILYRIHDANTVGIREVTAADVFGRFIRQITGKSDRANIRMDRARLLLNYYPNVKPDIKSLLEKYAFYKRSFKDKKALWDDKELIKSSGENAFVFKVKIFLNFI